MRHLTERTIEHTGRHKRSGKNPSGCPILVVPYETSSAKTKTRPCHFTTNPNHQERTTKPKPERSAGLLGLQISSKHRTQKEGFMLTRMTILYDCV